MSPYILSEFALIDLGEILYYYVENAGPDVAYRMRRQFFDQFARIAEHPGIGHTRSDLTSRPFVFFPSDPYLIFYERDDSPITIHAILHGARDIKQILKDRSF